MAQVFKKWCLDVLFPEEIFFQTLCRIDQNVYYQTSDVIQDKSPTLDMNRGSVGSNMKIPKTKLRTSKKDRNSNFEHCSTQHQIEDCV